MPTADPVLELLENVLARRPVAPALVAGLVRDRVPEGLYLEYKRGAWLTPESSQDLRDHVSAFANAEGGVLIIGIVDGEESQGPAKWSFEEPVCPDKAGWQAWLGRVLSDISTKTRTEHQVVSVEGKSVVLIAANRAQELIRVYEKRRLVCYLRIQDNTHPIDETLFADLALGRRAKPDLAIEDLVVRGGGDSRGFFVTVNLTVHNQGLHWVPDLSVISIGYASGSEPAVSASLRREIDLRPTTRDGLAPVVLPFSVQVPTIYGGTWKSASDIPAIEVRPFELRKFVAQIERLPNYRQNTAWAWYGGVMVLPKNGTPRWAQIAVQGENDVAVVAKGWALRSGTAPVVGWFEGPDVPARFQEFFDAAPSE